MNVELIGTGAMYTKYNGASTLINDDIIVDMPNGTIKQLLKKNYKPEKIKTILITHLHGDHTADLPFFYKYIYHKEGISGTTIIGPQGIENKIEQLFNAYNFEDKRIIDKKKNIKYIEISEQNIVVENVNEFKVEAIQVKHGIEELAYGYVINNSLGLTGDTSICDGVKEIIKNSKTIIADSTLLTGDFSHMGIDNIEYLAKTYQKQIIPTHLLDTTREKLREMNIENVLLVEDGYKFEI